MLQPRRHRARHQAKRSFKGKRAVNEKGTLFLALAAVAALIVFFINTKNQNKPLRALPYFNPKNYSQVKHEAHHAGLAFSFTDQYGKTVTEKTTEGKIYVCDYFFTTCQSICPVMSD